LIEVDTSVWVDFFRGAERAAALARLLEEGEVLLHPWTLGELMLGNLGVHRSRVVADLHHLPAAPRLADPDLLEFIEVRQLSGRGIGWVDAQLLAAALVGGAELWTFDRTLEAAASELGIVWTDASA
jgi:hypothetical protein